MLDFGWFEFLIVLAVAVFAIGPKELPRLMRSIGKFVRRVQNMRFALTRQFDALMEEEEEERPAEKHHEPGRKTEYYEDLADMDENYISAPDRNDKNETNNKADQNTEI